MKEPFNGNLVRSAVLLCPRCGYDLRGVMGQWSDSCPLDGTCSECGYDIDWSATMRGPRDAPRWIIEFTPRLWSPGPFFRTLIGQFRPRQLWRAIRIEYDVRPARLAFYLVRLVILCAILWYVGWIVFAAWYTSAGWSAPGSIGLSVGGWFEYVTQPLANSSDVIVTHPDGTVTKPFPPAAIAFNQWLTYGGPKTWQHWFVADLLWGVLGPIVLILGWLLALAGTPEWIRDERLRFRHFIRLGAYALSFAVINRLATPALFALPLIGFREYAWPDDREIVEVQRVAFIVIFFVAFPWWYFVCRDYLRLKNPLRVAIAVHLFGFFIPLGLIGIYRAIEAVMEWM